MSAKPFPLRCLLFVPGDSRRKMTKAAQLGADAVILDLEDAVAVSQKEEARQIIAAAVNTIDFGQTGRLIRINAAHTPWFADDLGVVSALPVEGVVLPKIDSAGQYHLIAQKTDLPLYLLIESARAIINLPEIVRADPPPAGLLFGAEDYRVDLGAAPSPDKRELNYARSAVVNAAAAYGIPAIDMVYTDLKNLDGLANEAQAAQRMGFAGKMAIHPHQVPLIQQVFSPSAAEIAQAQAIVRAYRAHETAGEGVFALDGRMVDKPIVLAAEKLLARAGISPEREG